MKSKTLLSLTLAALVCIAVGTMAVSTVWADTANLNPSDDSYVRSNHASENNGTAEVLIVRKHITGGPSPTAQNNRALLRFDLSGIPAGSTINAASLILYMETAPASSRNYELHYGINDSWLETTVTYTNAFTGGSPAPGLTALLDTIPTGTTLPVPLTWGAAGPNAATEGLTARVALEFAGDQIISLIIKDAMESESPARESFFTSKDTTTLNAIPVLVVDYTPAGPAISVEKNYRYTNVCFEKDNDGDGLFNEDPIDFYPGTDDPIDNDEDGLFNEDDVDCPDGTYLGDFLPMDDEEVNYLLEAVVNKRGVVKSYNPGQYYAVSTVNVLTDVNMLTIEEDFSYCTDIGTLNPVNGGGKVVIVQVGPGDPDEVAYQILDAKSPEVLIIDDVATVILGPQEAGTTILVYVKFGPGLKGEEWEGPYEPCVNTTSAWVVADTGDDDIESDNAMLELLLKE